MGQSGLKFTVPLSAFTTVLCIKTDSIWRLKCLYSTPRLALKFGDTNTLTTRFPHNTFVPFHGPAKHNSTSGPLPFAEPVLAVLTNHRSVTTPTAELLATRYHYKNYYKNYSLHNQATEINFINCWNAVSFFQDNIQYHTLVTIRRDQHATGPGKLRGERIHRSAVNFPPFWPDRPSLCFAQAEAQFVLTTVTCERTKFK